jgi:hypothetical protein
VPEKSALTPLLLALLLPLTACGPQINITGSERLEALLPSESDYPDGFDVEPIDMEEVNGTRVAGPDFDSVEPAACEEAMSHGPGELPEEAAEGAGQVAVVSSSSRPLVYTYVLVSGGDDEAEHDASAYEAVTDACSRMTVVNEGVGLEGGFRSAGSPDLPGLDDKLTLELSAEDVDTVMWMAWGKVEDVHFFLMGMAVQAERSGLLQPGVDTECLQQGYQCYRDKREAAAAEAREVAEEDFDAFLALALQTLEEGL